MDLNAKFMKKITLWWTMDSSKAHPTGYMSPMWIILIINLIKQQEMMTNHATICEHDSYLQQPIEEALQKKDGEEPFQDLKFIIKKNEVIVLLHQINLMIRLKKMEKEVYHGWGQSSATSLHWDSLFWWLQPFATSAQSEVHPSQDHSHPQIH